jgi:RNA polymerase sigma-70 factor (ECF subfamily)
MRVAEGAEVSASSGSTGRRPRSGTSLGRAPDSPDERLIERVASGETEAIGLLYDRYCRPAFSLAKRICGDDGIAQDAVQEAFLALWHDPQRFESRRGAFDTSLMALVHHKAVDAVRRDSAARRRPGPGVDGAEDWNAPGGGASQVGLNSVLAGQVRDALGNLPDDQREALALTYYAGYTQHEVAAITGVPIGTVKSRMFTGVQRLRRALQPLRPDTIELFGVDR